MGAACSQNCVSYPILTQTNLINAGFPNVTGGTAPAPTAGAVSGMPKDYQVAKVETYRRHFAMPARLVDGRVFLHFDRVMAAATPVLNGHPLAPHLGGYLPFQREITGLDPDILPLSRVPFLPGEFCYAVR